MARARKEPLNEFPVLGSPELESWFKSKPIANAEVPYVTGPKLAVVFTTLTPLYSYTPVVPPDRENESSIQELRVKQFRVGHQPPVFPMPAWAPEPDWGNALLVPVVSKKLTVGCHTKLFAMLLPVRPRAAA